MESCEARPFVQNIEEVLVLMIVHFQAIHLLLDWTCRNLPKLCHLDHSQKFHAPEMPVTLCLPNKVPATAGKITPSLLQIMTRKDDNNIEFLKVT